ncbi:MAG TPA: hypothetical protein VMV32_10710 [Ignavibacteriaceae bacterium]|nr:hypothetical protein [Ignavibacteriaceae bacterium]
MKHKMVGVEGGKTFSIEQVGIERERETLINMIALAPKASIIHVHAYESKNGHGEVANFFYLKGVDYGRMKERSLDTLNEIANNPDFSISVTRGVWQDSEGINHNRKAKDREFKTVTAIYNHDNELLTEAITKVEQSILNPQYKGAEYDKQGNGIYQQEDGTLHIRDCRLLHKVVIREGDYPQTASGELVALTNAIKKMLPISKYRQVRLDGRYDYLTIGGEIIMQDEGGKKVYVGFAEHKGFIKPRITGLEDELPLVKVPVETIKQVTEPEAEIDKEILDLLG